MIFIARLGAQHPDSVKVIQNHIILLHEMGRLEDELPKLSPAYIPVLRKMQETGEIERFASAPPALRSNNLPRR